MRIVDAEIFTLVIAPESQNSQHRFEQSALIGSVEIDRIDILDSLGGSRRT